MLLAATPITRLWVIQLGTVLCCKAREGKSEGDEKEVYMKEDSSAVLDGLRFNSTAAVHSLVSSPPSLFLKLF